MRAPRTPLVALALVLAAQHCTRTPAGAAATALTEPRSARVTRAGAAVTLDGRLDEPGWNSAVALTPLVNPQSGEVDPRPFSARLLWDDDALYVGVRADDEDIVAAPLPPRGQDTPQCGFDCIDLLLDAAGDGHNYAEIQLSPLGALSDAQWAAPRDPGPHVALAWKSNAVGAVSVLGTVGTPGDTDHGWSAELRVPWSALGRTAPPDANTTVRANLYVRDVSSTGTANTLAYTGSWCTRVAKTGMYTPRLSPPFATVTAHTATTGR